MKILTVRQPWAWAIIHGGKDVENRSRNIAGSYRGPVAIHAGQLDAEDTYRTYGAIADATGRPFGIETWAPNHRAAIIGVVDLVGVHESSTLSCHRTSGQPGMCSEWAQGGAVHIELANPRTLTAPIPYKGALGLRTLPDDVTARIMADLGGAL